MVVSAEKGFRTKPTMIWRTDRSGTAYACEGDVMTRPQVPVRYATCSASEYELAMHGDFPYFLTKECHVPYYKGVPHAVATPQASRRQTDRP